MLRNKIYKDRLQSVTGYLRSLVHDSVKSDVLARVRHQSFIASHMIGGAIALVIFPLYITLSGEAGTTAAIAFVWLISPVGIAVFLSKTGRLQLSHFLSAVNLGALVTFCAALTGGLSSFLIAWMIVVPLEAALSADRRVVLWAGAVAGAGIALLFALGEFGLLPPAQHLAIPPHSLFLIGALSAAVYAGGLAMSIQTLHAESERAIQLSEQRYRMLAENATDMITRHGPGGKVAFASHGAERLLGETVETLVGEGLFDRVHIADRSAYTDALDSCARTGRPLSVEFRVLSKSEPEEGARRMDAGRFIWVEMRCRPVADSGKTDAPETGVVAVTRDISLSKVQEAELRKARDDAESANTAKGRFLANMSHELRTPLNAVIGFSELLKRELPDQSGSERHCEYAGLIHESGEHLLAVVNDILDMSKIEAGSFTIERESLDIGDLVSSTRALIEPLAARKSIELTGWIEQDLPEISADRRACRQMLLNLLANAVKFTPDGGRIEVSTRLRGEMIDIAVADSGIGIAADDLPKLGNPFFQAESSLDRRYEGTGLGLSVVKGLAGLHGGSLNIASEPGAGTTATIRLPVKTPKTVAVETGGKVMVPHSSAMDNNQKVPKVRLAANG